MANTTIPSELSSTPSISDSGDATAITIDSSERVGIGTTSPDFLLDVEGSNTQFKVGTASQDGGFLTSTDENQLIVSGGFYYNGTNFIASAGSASGVSFDNGGTFFYNNTSLTDGNSFTLNETVRITDAAKVGIGTTSPDGKTDIAQAQNTTAASFTTPHLALTATGTTNTTGFTGISYASSTLTNYGWTVGAQRTGTGGSGAAFVFRYHSNSAAGYEHSRFDANQFLIARTSGSISAEEQGLVLNRSGYIYCARDGSGSATVLAFARKTDTTAVNIGSITTSGTATAYNTSSDYRLKENVVTDWDATTRLKQLKPSRFNFIDDADTTVDGFLAHEVSDIVPEAITGEKDATEAIGNLLDADGNIIDANVSQSEANVDTDAGETWQETGTRPIYQAIDQAKLVPLLVKTIQELEARITTLENS